MSYLQVFKSLLSYQIAHNILSLSVLRHKTRKLKRMFPISVSPQYERYFSSYMSVAIQLGTEALLQRLTAGDGEGGIFW